ncbi:homocysteine S-methyltransferase-like [Hylaeus anthracinus]|uniref:homocysteine S-methyltransferase-like n=1 Tax=Hylaeus volcanicus TaxID=313075 RepID=UPI0023B7933C|nr:homocysteine S-methyltransferase-like [Hylaeus volcanicus]XP_053984009.1 homocysteine S-methyltransferase-like [Hylaeus volcanicus]XP_053984014.1 homocysteine S-methyltransferase-like [Hylaeus volcanicus]XP_054004301.1 homocysteine S-methyltransferase-like [Hylaeus anthracinus]XP_054004302.1 homocysteine S-methyltransferase-like [Hylaeus anthracinus]
MVNVKILDGGFSAQLSTHVGAKIDGDPLWTARFLATNPDAVYATHLDFLRAGADIIETNTYQASVSGLTKYLSITEDESIKLLHEAVNLAKRAINDYTNEIAGNNDVENKEPLIAGSCGPYGASLHNGSEYNGAYGKTVPCKVMMEWHKSRIDAFIDAGIELLALETIPCYQEAEALVELLKQYPNVKAWLSFSCKRNSQNIVDGSRFQEVATHCYKMALPGQIIAIGVNCIAPRDVTPLLKNINKGGENEFIPLIAYPNNGEIYSIEGWVKDENCTSFESFIPEWLDLGIRYIGGCCRIYADNIKSIRKEVNSYKKKKEAMD